MLCPAVGDTDRTLTMAQQQRATHLYTLFIAPCCWRQSVAVHQSAPATHVRSEIDGAVISGKSDAEIKNALIREYGHGILMDPEGVRGVVAYTGPLLFLLIGSLVTLSWMRSCAKRGDQEHTSVSIVELPELEALGVAPQELTFRRKN